MKTINILFLALLGTISISAINCTYSSSSVSKQDNDSKKEVRSVSSFNEIDLSTSADIKVVQGSPQKVEMEGSSSDLQKIITVTEGSKLVIKTKPGTWHVGKVIVYITMEKVNGLFISGSGSIISESPVKTSKLGLDISGSGSINLSDLSAEDINSEVSGSGSIKLNGKGQVNNHRIAISGSGNVAAGELKTSEVKVEISGSGDCKVFATEKLKIDVSGSGDVYYAGKPVINADVSGSGKVREMKG